MLKLTTREIQYEPGHSERYDTDGNHPERVDHRKKVAMAHHRNGIQKSPKEYLDSEDEKTANPPVAHIAEPKQPQNIRDCAAYQNR